MSAAASRLLVMSALIVPCLALGAASLQQRPSARDDTDPEALIEQGQFERARQAGELALEAARQAGDRRAEVAALDTLGNAYFYLGDTPRALDFFRRTLLGARELRDEAGEAIALKNVGIAYQNIGSLEDALGFLQQALDIGRRLNDPVLVASSLENIGISYSLLGAHRTALEFFQQTLEIAREHQLSDQMHHVLVDLGKLLMDRGQPDRARARFEEALALAEQENHLVGQSYALEGLGLAYAALGDVPNAIATAQRCLALSRSIQHQDAATHCIWNLGYHHVQSDPGLALSFFQEALTAGGRREPDANWWELSGLGAAFLGLGQSDRAVDYYQRAVGRLERSRDEVASAEYRASFLGQHHSTYTDLIELLLEQHRHQPDLGHDARAFHVFERSRARTMAEAVAQARAGILDDTGSGPRVGGAAALSAEPFTLEEAQAILSPSTALLAYSASRRHVVAFLVTSSSFRAQLLAVSPDALATRVGNYVDLVARDDAAGSQAASRRLYQDLLAPLAPQLPAHVRQLVVVPSGVLHFLPFEALISSSPGLPPRYVVEDFAVSYAPSATLLAELAPSRSGSNRPAQSDLIVFANAAQNGFAAPPAGAAGAPLGVRALYDDEGLAPDRLPFSAAEARGIAAYAGAGSRVLLDMEASEYAVKQLPLDRYRVVHFAAHGLISQQAPSRSALVLAPGDPREDGFLQAREIYGLKLAADLVVLSGCQTARGQILAGEGVQGLVRASFHAGAHSVLASLWNVNDRSTATFMEAFYEHLAEGQATSQALRSAKLQVLRDNPGLTPRHWAAFVLNGHPDGVIPLGGPGPATKRAWWLAMAFLLLGLASLAAFRTLRSRSGASRA